MAKKKLYRYPLYLLARGTAATLALLPRSVLLLFARGLGKISFALITRQRDKTLENLTFAFGREKSPEEIKDLAGRVFENAAMTAAEILKFPEMNPARIQKIVEAGNAEQVYRDLLARNKGLISLTAHIGNWELLAGAMASLGFQGGVIARRIYYEPFNRWIVGLRSSVNVPTIYRDESPRALLKILKKGGIVGILPDQDIDSLKSIFVDFLGRPAYTPVAPAKLSLASGAPILPNFLLRSERGKYRLLMGQPIDPADFSKSDDAVHDLTCAWMKACEEVIRKYPDQWAWMHNRWKTRPEDPRFSKTLKSSQAEA